MPKESPTAKTYLYPGARAIVDLSVVGGGPCRSKDSFISRLTPVGQSRTRLLLIYHPVAFILSFSFAGGSGTQ